MSERSPEDWLTETDVKDQYGEAGLQVVFSHRERPWEGRPRFEWVLKPHHPVPVIKRHELEAAIVADAERRLQGPEVFQGGILERAFHDANMSKMTYVAPWKARRRK